MNRPPDGRERPEPALATRHDASDAGIVFDRVSFSFDDHQVLRDLSFELPRGRMMMLLGASGSGEFRLQPPLGHDPPCDRLEAAAARPIGHPLLDQAVEVPRVLAGDLVGDVRR